MAAFLKALGLGAKAAEGRKDAIPLMWQNDKIQDLSGKRHEGPLEKAGVSTQLTRDSAAAAAASPPPPLPPRCRRRRAATIAAPPPPLPPRPHLYAPYILLPCAYHADSYLTSQASGLTWDKVRGAVCVAHPSASLVLYKAGEEAKPYKHINLAGAGAMHTAKAGEFTLMPGEGHPRRASNEPFKFRVGDGRKEWIAAIVDAAAEVAKTPAKSALSKASLSWSSSSSSSAAGGGAATQSVKRSRSGESVNVGGGGGGGGGDGSAKDFDVMFSYSWNDKFEDKSYKVDALKAEADRMGLSVWLDRKDAHGSTEKFMTEAVTKSKVIVALVSSNYAASASCRFELDMANKRRKKIVFVNAGDAKFVPTKAETYSAEAKAHAVWLQSIIKDELWHNLNVGSKGEAKVAIGNFFKALTKAKAEVVDEAEAERGSSKRRLDFSATGRK